MFITYNLIVWLGSSREKFAVNKLQIRTMPFSVIIAIYGYMLKTTALTQKHVSFYKKAQ